MKAALARVRATLADVLVSLPWAELAAGVALVAGWLLVTWALASMLRTWQVWPLSAGLALLSLFGWRVLRVIALDGLYALTREAKAPRGKA